MKNSVLTNTRHVSSPSLTSSGTYALQGSSLLALLLPILCAGEKIMDSFTSKIHTGTRIAGFVRLHEAMVIYFDSHLTKNGWILIMY